MHVNDSAAFHETKAKWPPTSAAEPACRHRCGPCPSQKPAEAASNKMARRAALLTLALCCAISCAGAGALSRSRRLLQSAPGSVHSQSQAEIDSSDLKNVARGVRHTARVGEWRQQRNAVGTLESSSTPPTRIQQFTAGLRRFIVSPRRRGCLTMSGRQKPNSMQPHAGMAAMMHQTCTRMYCALWFWRPLVAGAIATDSTCCLNPVPLSRPCSWAISGGAWPASYSCLPCPSCRASSAAWCSARAPARPASAASAATAGTAGAARRCGAAAAAGAASTASRPACRRGTLMAPRRAALAPACCLVPCPLTWSSRPA